MKTFNSVSMSEGMKKYVRFFIACVCALMAFPLAAQAQIQNGNKVTIRSNGYYLAVEKDAKTSNYKLKAISIEKPTKECFWTVTIQNNQYSFVNVVASGAGKNAALQRSSNDLQLANTGSAFTLQSYSTAANQTVGRLYVTDVSSNWWGSSTSYKFIHYTPKQNQTAGTWGISSKSSNTSTDPSLLTIEKWTEITEAGGLVGEFDNTLKHFALAKTDDEAASQAQTLRFTITRKPQRSYYQCLPRAGQDYSEIAISGEAVDTTPIAIKNISFTWQKSADETDKTISYANAGTYGAPTTLSKRPVLSVSPRQIEGTTTCDVTITPVGTSPMNIKDVNTQIDHTDVLIARFSEQQDQTEQNYYCELPVLRHSYHRVDLPRFIVASTPVSYTFPKTGGTTDIVFSVIHQHGFSIYSPAGDLAYKEETVFENLKLSETEMVAGTEGKPGTAKISFEFTNKGDQTTATWLREDPSKPFQNNTLSIKADDNSNNNVHRDARLVCSVQYSCNQSSETYTEKYEIAIGQRVKEGSISFIPQHGFANRHFGKNPHRGTDEQLVHTAEQTIYYDTEVPIRLRLPEAEFLGYKRWYDYKTGCAPNYNQNPADRTTWAKAPRGRNINTTYGDSHGIYSIADAEDANHKTDTVTPIINGWADGGYHIIACDVSNFKDYEVLQDKDGDYRSVTEPTLSYRQLWHMRPAREMADKFAELAALTPEKYLEEHHYTAPTNTTIYLVPNFGHNRKNNCFNCYFYYNDPTKREEITRVSGTAEWYDSSKKEAITPTSYTAEDWLAVSSTTEGEKTYYLRVPNAMGQGKDLLIAKFTVNFVDKNTHGPVEKELISRKQITEEYVLLEEIDFNYDPLPTTTGYSPIYHPMPWGETTYGYFYPDNLLGGDDKYVQHSNRQLDPPIPYYGEYFLTNYMNADWATGTQHGDADDGYALFVDGTTQPGLVATISTEATICSGQTMYCSMWLLNPRKQGKTSGAANPIFRCNIQGRNKDTDGNWGEWHDVGVFFVGAVEGGGKKWHQVNFPVLSEAVSYAETRVALYNFGTGGNGNDFMVDDIRLYVSPLSLAAYQATMGCETFTEDEANTAVVVRMDYSTMNIYGNADTGEENNKYAYYQIYNENDDKVIALTAPVQGENETITYEPAYYNDDNSEHPTYGSVTIPRPTYEPTQTEGGGGDNIQTSIRDYINSLIDSKTRNGKCYIWDKVTKKWFLYVIHIIPNIEHHESDVHVANSHLQKGKSYVLRISHAASELGRADCASRTPLHATQDTYLELHHEGEDNKRVECLPNVCANDFYQLEVKMQNTLATSVGGSLQTVEANVHADWLWGYDFDDVYCERKTMTPTEKAAADAAFNTKYGCTRDVVRSAIAAMRRVPTNEHPNPNYRVAHYRDLQVVQRVEQIGGEEQQTVVDFSQEQIELITRLCKEGLLTLYKTTSMFYLGSQETVRFWVYPIAEDAVVTINKEKYTLFDCDEPKWVKITSAHSYYGVNISPADLTKLNPQQRLQLPTVRIPEPKSTDGNTAVEIPIKAITQQTQLYSTLHNENNNKIVFDLKNPIHDVLEFVEIVNNRIEVAATPTTWEAGREYLMRMSFYDNQGRAYIDGDEDKCRVGYVYFYVLIVPNTVRWTGAVSNEWGDDDNWKGVRNDGTLMDIGYAPLAGTNVIIPNITDVSIPYPSIGSTDLYPQDINYEHFTCNDIYFAPGAMLHNQHLLHYNRAFVDMQLQANDWNAMSPPLQGMYTGDIYVPHSGKYNNDESKTGQSVESNYPFVVNSFQGERTTKAPYVFWQAIYNKRVKNQHENGNTSSPALTNEALFVQTNTLDYQLQPGTGFQVLAFGPRHKADDEIIIRLPKPDDHYYYYYKDGTPSNQSVSVPHSSQLAFTPNDGGVMTITLQNDLASNQFMFGNPTMANINMVSFLDRNKDKLADQYYTFSSSSWQAKSIKSIQATGEPGTLAPMRSVMLQLKEGERNSITLTLSAEDLVEPGVQSANSEQPAGIAPRQSLAAADDTPQAMTIYATSSNGQAQCMLLATPQAHNTYDAMEDVLFISTGVETSNILTTPINMYTVADQVPMMIDVRQDIDTIPLSMLVHDDYRTDTVEFAFYLTLNWDKECYFYDAFTDARYRIMDGMFVSLPMPQNHENRYFILGPDDSSNGGIVSSTTQPTRPDEHAIRIWAYAPNQGELIVCSNDIIQEVKVYDVAGRLIAHQVPQLQYNTLTIPCPAGVCIVEATTRDRTQHYTRTIVK